MRITRIALIGLMMLFVCESPVARGEKIPASFSAYRLIDFEDGALYVSPDLKTTSGRLDTGHGGRHVELFNIRHSQYAIGFEIGDSDAAIFTLFSNTNGAWNSIGSVQGYRLFLSASGSIYTRSDSATLPDINRKFSIQGNRLVETEQPMLLINDQCKTGTAVVLRSGISEKSPVVARLPKNGEVQVVATQFFFDGDEETSGPDGSVPVLISTPFGLTGWVSAIPAMHFSAPPKTIDCIYYRGS